MNESEPVFRNGAVRPLECLSRGWQLVKDRYWLLVGITTVGILIGSIAPMAVLLGPCMCGIYYCLIRRERGQTIEFSMLFKGFDYFVQSLIATLIMIVPMIVLIVPIYLFFFVSLLSEMPKQPPNAPPDPALIRELFGKMALLYAAIFAIAIVVNIFFFFIYALIVDRGLSGVEAVKTSATAALANFWGIVGLLLLNGEIGLVGVMCCYVGAFLVMPITFAAVLVAYRQVFPEVDSVPILAPAAD